jgi:hypothetical protein
MSYEHDDELSQLRAEVECLRQQLTELQAEERIPIGMARRPALRRTATPPWPSAPSCSSCRPWQSHRPSPPRRCPVTAGRSCPATATCGGAGR